ncbi:endonuclease, partial [uncultured Muribaculum sp.]
KGDFARALMYMVSVYPPSIWQGWGDVMLLGNEYPTMRDHSVTLYLKWHYDDPVSPLELQRNDRIEAIQGNRNPFVDHPELIDYIWGLKAGEIYGTHDAPVDPDAPDRKRTPLKGSYTVADGAVDLYSPYVPDDAEWTIDLQPVAGKSLPIDDIAAGHHELRYTAGDMKGRLIINITK